jgi:hypothetical protein
MTASYSVMTRIGHPCRRTLLFTVRVNNEKDARGERPNKTETEGEDKAICLGICGVVASPPRFLPYIDFCLHHLDN